MKTNDQLVSFLYELMRDHLPVGVINQLVEDSTCLEGEGFELSDGMLVIKARAAAKALRNRRPPPGEKRGWWLEVPAGILCNCGEVHPPRDMDDHLRSCEEGESHYQEMKKRVEELEKRVKHCRAGLDDAQMALDESEDI